jgi:hypothetical protein
MRPAVEAVIGIALMLVGAVKLLIRRGSPDPSSLDIALVGDRTPIIGVRKQISTVVEVTIKCKGRTPLFSIRSLA